MSTTATHVMIFSVYGVEEAFAIVSEFSGVSAGMTFGNSAPKMKMTTAAIATVVEKNAHPSDRLAVRNTVATRAIAATSTGIQVRVCAEWASWAHSAQMPAAMTVGTARRAASLPVRARISPSVFRAQKIAPWGGRAYACSALH